MSKIVVAIEGKALIYYYQSMHYNKHNANMELVSELVLWAEKIPIVS
jgi:hypothetical protein